MNPLEGRLRRETDEVEVFRFEVPGEPVSKSRARYNGQGPKVRAYTPTSSAEAETVVAWRYRQTLGGGAQVDDRSGYGLACTFYVEKRQRRDVDNMIKLVADALNGVAWADDSQVTEVSGRVVHGSDQPRTVVELYRTPDLPDHLRRTCCVCGNEFRTYASWEKKKTCSAECGRLLRAANRRRTCPGCRQTFCPGVERRQARYCSDACRVAHRTVSLTCEQCAASYHKPRSLHRPHNRTFCTVACRNAFARDRRKVGAAGLCDSCGGPTTKKIYIQCMPCRSAGVRAPGRLLVSVP